MKKKEMIPLTIEEKQSYHEQSISHACKKEFNTNDKKYYKVTSHCHYTGRYRSAAHNVCNLRYLTPKEIAVVFHNGFKYDYHFLIKELVKESEVQFKCLGEKAEKYITFSEPIKKELENNCTQNKFY